MINALDKTAIEVKRSISPFRARNLTTERTIRIREVVRVFFNMEKTNTLIQPFCQVVNQYDIVLQQRKTTSFLQGQCYDAVVTYGSIKSV